MAITLNHTIVPAKDKETAARFFAEIFGLEYKGAMGHFAPVQVNDTLTFDFDTNETFDMHHYAFHMDDLEFEGIYGRVKAAGIIYGSGPFSATDGRVSTTRGGRRFYFHDPDGHLLEVFTGE